MGVSGAATPVTPTPANPTPASAASGEGSEAPSEPAEAPEASPRAQSAEEPPADATSEELGVARDPSWGTGDLFDVGPAGPASASSRGVVMVTKHGEVVILPVDAQGRFRELSSDQAVFARYGRGPALTDQYAYFISLDGRLLQAPLRDPGNVKELASNARSGTRVSALRQGDRELVAFVAEIEGEPVSLLWSSSGELLRVTPEGSTASSVQLATLGRGAVVVSLEGRTGMSPVHARLIRLAQRRVNLDEDRVVWVGPGVHPLTELLLIARPPDSAVAFLGVARSITEFGLASLTVQEALTPTEEARWTLFPNGIDPAPTAAAALCGKPFLFYAQPSTAKPRAPQELRVAEVRADGLGTPEVLARARAFNDISVAPRPGGAVLVWTADRRTWAITLRCPTGARATK